MDAMPNSNAARGEQPQGPAAGGDDPARERAAVEHHLQQMLARLQAAMEQPESPERAEELRGVTGEYVLGLLEGMVADDGRLEAQLISLGARTMRGTWQLDSDLFTLLTDEMALSLPTRLKALKSGQYKDVRELNTGMNKQLRNLVGRYRPRMNPNIDRRPRPGTGPAAAM